MNDGRILVVSRTKLIGNPLVQVLQAEGYQVESTTSYTDARRSLTNSPAELILLDSSLLNDSSVELLAELKHLDSQLMVIAIDTPANFATTRALQELKIDGAIADPYDLNTIKQLIEKSVASRQSKRPMVTNQHKMNHQSYSDHLVGISPVMTGVLKLIDICVESDCRTILISGESGTGKGLVARTIHLCSRRCNAPFIDINCAAIFDNHLTKELFGSEKKSFIENHSSEKGIFERADNGTVFLDEIGDMPLSMQKKILRFIEEQFFQRVDGGMNLATNVRIIAATNQNLKEHVEKGLFRSDLYSHLNVVNIVLPPLRERHECIPELVEFFIGRINTEYGKNIQGVTSAAMTYLQRYDWPGNVRELRNTLEHAIMLEDSPLLTVDFLPVEVRLGGEPDPENLESAQATAKMEADKYSGIRLPPEGITLEELEKKMIEQALIRFSGNQTKAAHCLGMSRDTIRYRMKKFGLKRG